MKDQIHIRKAVPGDGMLISEISKTTFYEAFAWGNTAENMQVYLSTAFDPSVMELEIAQGDSYFFLAYCGTELGGYAKLGIRPTPELPGARTAEIERIYVYQAFQGKAIGRSLMYQCLAAARAAAAEVVWLGVWEHNPKAIAFYERLGFHKFGTHGFQIGDDLQQDLLLKLEL